MKGITPHPSMEHTYRMCNADLEVPIALKVSHRFISLGFLLVYFITFLVVWSIWWKPSREVFWEPCVVTFRGRYSVCDDCRFLKWLIWYGVSWSLDYVWLRSQLFQSLCVDGSNKNWILRPELYAFIDTAVGIHPSMH